MRVVAGSARGRALVTPSGTATRPTSDKVRQAVFNALQSLGLLDEADIVDLFAGSGALGIEALSRGAASVVFVEQDRAAVACIAENLRLVPGARNRIERISAERFLESPRDRFDLALVDPPYAYDGWPNLLASIPADVVVLESNREIDPGPGWEIMRSRAYGSTVVVFARRTDTSVHQDT